MRGVGGSPPFRENPGSASYIGKFYFIIAQENFSRIAPKFYAFHGLCMEVISRIHAGTMANLSHRPSGGGW